MSPGCLNVCWWLLVTLLLFLSINTAWKKAPTGWAFALAAPWLVQRHLLLPVLKFLFAFPRGSGAAGPDASGQPGRLLAAFTWWKSSLTHNLLHPAGHQRWHRVVQALWSWSREWLLPVPGIPHCVPRNTTWQFSEVTPLVSCESQF